MQKFLNERLQTFFFRTLNVKGATTLGTLLQSNLQTLPTLWK